MARNHVILIGVHDTTAGARTVGSGFLVEVHQRCWAVTCRHIIRDAGRGALFALPKPMKTKTPRGGYFVLALGPPRFHPADSEHGTYDVAVAEVIDCDRRALLTREIEPVAITTQERTVTFPDGTRVTASGYPIDYATRELAAGSDEPMPPREIEGVIRTIPLHLARQNGFSGALLEALFAQTLDGEQGGKGMSGSIVNTVEGNGTVGMLLGDGSFEYAMTDHAVEKFGGFVVASINRIAEALNV